MRIAPCTKLHRRRLVDSELLSVIDPYPQVGLPITDVREVRNELARMLAASPRASDARVERAEVWIPGRDGARDVRALIYSPVNRSGPLPAVLHIHGGGYVVGAPEFAEAGNLSLAADLGCLVCSVDYRLAPEHPHPAPLDDCYTALTWLHDEAAVLALDRTRVAVKGESAGGGIAAALALAARDAGGPPLRFQHLTAPVIDDRTCVEVDPHPLVGEFVWNRERNSQGWEALLGHPPGLDGVSYLAAAARARDLTNLPAAHIAVGALDLFLEENRDYGRRLTRAGVPVEMHVYPGAFHGFGAAGQARVAQAAARDSREALRRALLG